MVWKVLAPFDMISCWWHATPGGTFITGKLYEPATPVPALEDEPDEELPLPQCRAIQGLHKVWHIPSKQLITIKVMTHKSIAIKNVKTMAIPVASIITFTYLSTILMYIHRIEWIWYVWSWLKSYFTFLRFLWSIIRISLIRRKEVILWCMKVDLS